MPIQLQGAMNSLSSVSSSVTNPVHCSSVQFKTILDKNLLWISVEKKRLKISLNDNISNKIQKTNCFLNSVNNDPFSIRNCTVIIMIRIRF